MVIPLPTPGPGDGPNWAVGGVSLDRESSVHFFCCSIHYELRSITLAATKVHVVLRSFWSVNMDAWFYRISVACDTGIGIRSSLASVGVVHSTWPSRMVWHVHAPTFNKWHKKKKKKKVTLCILTVGTMQGCGFTSLVVCINDKIRDIRERNVTIRSEIWTANIRSLGFGDIREWVILWRLLLRSLGCTLIGYQLGFLILLAVSSMDVDVLQFHRCIRDENSIQDGNSPISVGWLWVGCKRAKVTL